jgi:hypothetical protein
MRLLSLFLGTLVAVAPAAAAPIHEGHGHTINGRLQPELLPETSVWGHVIAAVYSFTGGSADVHDPEAQSFVRGNLFISDADAAILLQEVVTARPRLRRLELQPAVDGRWAARRKQIDDAILAARDQILRRLSPRGRKALLRWVALIKQGMSHGPSR